MKSNPISQKRKQELLNELEAKGISSSKIIETLIKCVDLADNVNDLLEVIELGFIPAKFGIVGIVLGPISNMIAIAEAKEAGYKLFKLKAISYTSTAWAYNHTPLPPSPPKKNLLAAKNWKGRTEEIKYAQEWKSAAQSTLKKLNQKKQIKGKTLSPKAYKLLLRHMSNNDPMQLAYSIWMSFQNRFTSAQDRSHFKNYTKGILYPD